MVGRVKVNQVRSVLQGRRGESRRSSSTPYLANYIDLVIQAYSKQGYNAYSGPYSADCFMMFYARDASTVPGTLGAI